jgi:hypothetical protein
MHFHEADALRSVFFKSFQEGFAILDRTGCWCFLKTGHLGEADRS